MDEEKEGLVYNYNNSLSEYSQLLTRFKEMGEVAFLLRSCTVNLLSNRNAAVDISEAISLIPSEKRDSFRKHVKEISYNFIGQFEKDINNLEKERHNLHLSLLEKGNALGKDELDVHLDIVRKRSPLEQLVSDEASWFSKFKKVDGGGYGHRIITDSGIGKLAVLIGVLRINIPYHKGECEWHIKPGDSGYSNLKVLGAPWGMPIEHSKYALNDYLSGNLRKISQYKSVIEGRNEEQDGKLIDEVNHTFPKFISFSGFAPVFYSHDKNYFNRVIEIDTLEIKKNVDDPALLVSNMLAYISNGLKN